MHPGLVFPLMCRHHATEYRVSVNRIYGLKPLHNVAAAATHIQTTCHARIAQFGYEQINFNGKAVRLYGRDGPGATAIDGVGIGPVVRCVSGEGTGTVLDGFKHSRYVVFQMAEVIVPRALFREILERIGRLRASPGFAEVG